jgi:TolB protein
MIANPDGSNRLQVVPTGIEPAWSPDGTRIAYASGPTFRTSIYVANVDGSNVRRATTPPDLNYSDEFPAWSPDGTRLVFQRSDDTSGQRPQRWVVYVVNVDGSRLLRVSPESLAATRPTW